MKSIKKILFQSLKKSLCSYEGLKIEFIKKIPYIVLEKRRIALTHSIIELSKNQQEADFQTNIAMILAKSLKENPRNLAQKLLAACDFSSFCHRVDVAGAGFINFYLKHSFIQERLKLMLNMAKLQVEDIGKQERILVDFSGPNIAKEMHVGHLRSTIIGDCIANILSAAGYAVKRINHIGDWGTQFGMLLAFIQEKKINLDKIVIDGLEKFYVEAKKLFDSNSDFAENSQLMLLKLQSKDPQALQVWQKIREKSLHHCEKIYRLLKIKIETKGESFYSDDLPIIVNDILKHLPFSNGVGTKESEGAIAVFFDKKEANELKIDYNVPFLIRRSNGGFLYSTTDLAALKDRLLDGYKKIIYVTDSRQKSHFAQVFSIIEKLIDCNTFKIDKDYELIHKGFGMILGANGKPLKTRDGGVIKLEDLLIQATQKAYSLAAKLSPHLSEEEKRIVSQEAGIGSVKYADLAHNMLTDYQFDWAKMLNHEGNTAFYLLINYARTHSLERKIKQQDKGFSYANLEKKGDLNFMTKEEESLAKQILFFYDMWEELVEQLTPHTLLSYIYKLGQVFSSFWSACPIIHCTEGIEVRNQRLFLVILTQKVLKFSLDILQIKALKSL